jgi:hypothetical protein
MSPQMNGEPRDDESRAADAMLPHSQEYEVGRPLPVAINTEGVSKATIKGDRQLAPLFNEGATTAFRSRWDSVQSSFVDDPKAAVHAADELVGEVTKSLTETFAKQRSDLESGSDLAVGPTTENLRIALRQYRSFFERLLAI